MSVPSQQSSIEENGVSRYQSCIAFGNPVVLIRYYQSHGTISTNLRVALWERASFGSALTFSLSGIWLAIPLNIHVPVGRAGIDSSVTPVNVRDCACNGLQVAFVEQSVNEVVVSLRGDRR
jgi:hypothetical protein